MNPPENWLWLVGQNGFLGVGLLAGVLWREAPSISDRITLDEFLERVAPGLYSILLLNLLVFVGVVGLMSLSIYYLVPQCQDFVSRLVGGVAV